MKNTTTDKKYYRRLLAVLQKSNGTTFADIAKEHEKRIDTSDQEVNNYS